MKAGRELDLKVIEAMGWVERDLDIIDPSNHDSCVWDYFGMKGAFLPSEDIAAAWTVVEGFDNFEIKQVFEPSQILCRLSDWQTEGFAFATAETSPLAICLAALKAKGVDVSKSV